MHVIGKGINRFHAIYWPAILLSAGLPLPTDIVVHGYLTVEGRKIGKSLGNAIDPLELSKRYGDCIQRISFYAPYKSDPERWHGVMEALKAA